MARILAIHFLGPFVCQMDGSVFQASLSRKTRSILAYLAITDVPQSRRALYTMFCQQTDDPQGALRWHLSRIRRQLSPEILIVEKESVQFDHRHCRVDAFEFARFLQPESLGALELDALEQILEAYQGEFLMGDSLPDSPEFDMWLLSQRSRLQQCAQRGMVRLVEGLIEAGQFNTAVGWAQKLLILDPLIETAHAQLIWLYAKLGQRESALRQFQKCQELLESELAVEPSDEIMQLHQEILSGEVVSRHITPSTQALVFQSQPTTDAFVGRESELQQLSDLWRIAQHDGLAIGLVEAEAGGGKSRLVTEFARRQSDIIFLQGRCYESASRQPYQPWIDLLEMRLERISDEALSQLAPVWHTHLSRLLPMLAVRLNLSAIDKGSVNVDERVMFTAVVEFLFKLPDTPPMILFLDDLQWADDASLRLFQFIARRIRDLESRSPVLLLGAYRTEEADDNPTLPDFIHDLHRTGPVITVSLLPLDMDAVDDLIRQQRHDGLQAVFDTQMIRDTVLQTTRGNPLYITELLQELNGLHELPDELPIPPSLNDLVQRRLRQLPDSGRQVIEAMAVADMPANINVAQRISGRSEDEVFTAIDAGLRWRLLKDATGEIPGVFNFSHDLMRETVRQQLNTLRRQRLHQRSAQVLSEIGAAPSQIAYHWREAGDLYHELQFTVRAGDEAKRFYSYHEANHFYSRALELASEPSLRGDLSVKLGDVLHKLGEWDRAERCFHEAHEEALTITSPQLIADSRYGLGTLMQDLGQWEAAHAYFNESLSIFQQLQDVAKQARVLGAIGKTYQLQGNYQSAVEYLEKQYGLGVEIDDMEATSSAQAQLGVVYLHFEAYDTALAYLQKSLDTARARNALFAEAGILGNMAIAYVHLNKPTLAEQLFNRQLTLNYDLGHRIGVARSTVNLANLLQRIGQYDLAMRYCLYCLRLCLDMKFERGFNFVFETIMAIAEHRDDFDLVQRVSQFIIRAAEVTNLTYILPHVLYLRASSLYFRGHYDQALDLNQEAISRLKADGRQKDLVKMQILDCQIRHGLQNYSLDQLITKLEQLMENTTDDTDKALLHFTLWNWDNTREPDKQVASTLFRANYDKSWNSESAYYYRKMTDITLPPPTISSPIPDFVQSSDFDLNALLEEAEATLEQSTS